MANSSNPPITQNSSEFSAQSFVSSNGFTSRRNLPPEKFHGGQLGDHSLIRILFWSQELSPPKAKGSQGKQLVKVPWQEGIKSCLPYPPQNCVLKVR
ncbi:hypothetical protein BaRGS_00039864 [Batillaria attramentaria]|uniref:Uncharacterized protein n=1 Tax=Batillaria attramentaria TaxID=370345 RepID=A0ABD0J2D8_9CAEN